MVNVLHSKLVRRGNTIQGTTRASSVPINAQVVTTGREHAIRAKPRLHTTRLISLVHAQFRSF